MSKEDVALLLQSVEAFNRRDLDAFLALTDDDIEVVSRIVAMEGGLHGRAGVKTWWESWLAAFPDYDIEIVDVREVGDIVLATLRAVGHGAGSNVPFEDKIWHGSRWRRGKCTWWRVFTAREEALEAAGLSE